MKIKKLLANGFELSALDVMPTDSKRRREKSCTRLVLTMAVVTFFAVFSSCSSDDTVFSCDPETNVWAKKNMSAISEMTRDSWLRIGDEEKEKAAYRAFSVNQRHDFWIDKINEVMALDWSTAEHEHLRELLQYVTGHENIFMDNPEGFDDSTLRFLYLWEETGREKLGWTDMTLYAILASGHEMIDKSGKLEGVSYLDVVEGERQTRSSSGCDCSTVSDWCQSRVMHDLSPTAPSIPGPVVVANCSDGECEASGSGCGTFFGYSCNGNCKYEYL